MTDAKVKEYARNVILNACESVGLSIEGESDIRIHPAGKASVVVVESETGEIGFQCDYSSPFGKSTTIYSPQPFIEWLKILLDKQLNSPKYSHIPAEYIRISSDEKISDIAKVLVSIVASEMWDATHQTAILSRRIANLLSSPNLAHQSENQLIEQISVLISNVNVNRSERILVLAKQQIENLSAPQYVFCDVYDSLLEQWREAKKFYNRNKRFANCLVSLKATYPDLPEDLIHRLTIPQSYDSQPAKLAFEHTASMLNIPNIPTADRSQARYLSKSRELRAEVSDEDVQTALDRFVSFTEKKDALDEQISEIIKNGFPDS